MRAPGPKRLADSRVIVSTHVPVLEKVRCQRISRTRVPRVASPPLPWSMARWRQIDHPADTTTFVSKETRRKMSNIGGGAREKTGELSHWRCGRTITVRTTNRIDVLEIEYSRIGA